MLNVLQPKSGSIICITGAGSVGLSSLMAVKLLNPPPLKIIAVDILSHRLELAIKYGATAVINSTEVSDLKQALLDASDGLGIDGSIDTTGQPEVVNALLEATAKQGTVVQVGVGLVSNILHDPLVYRVLLTHLQLTAVVSPVMFDTVNTGRIYRGCAMGSCDPLVFIPRLIKAWLDGDFPFTDLIKEYPASEIAHAVEEVSSGAVIKAVLSWS